jgi:hypothetical protein
MQKVSDAYDALTPNLHFDATEPQFVNNLSQVRNQAARNLDPNAARIFNNKVDDILNIGQQGANDIRGQRVKQVETMLNDEINKYRGTNASAMDKDIGDAFQSIQNSFRSSLMSQNPAQATELAKINRAWAEMKIVAAAGKKVSNPENPILPGQYQSAVREASSKVSKDNFSRGRANGQDMSDAMMAVLSDRYPNSGTAGRLITGGLIGGGIASINPILAATLGGTAGLYATDIGRRAMYAAIARRPELARQLGAGMQALGPNLGGALAGQKTRDFNK